MLAKSFVVFIMFLILYNLGRGMYFLINDKGDSKRTVKALTWRIGLSITLFFLLFLGYALGLIAPHGVGG